MGKGGLRYRSIKTGGGTKGQHFFIRLNKMTDIWVGESREWGDVILQRGRKFHNSSINNVISWCRCIIAIFMEI